MPTRAYGHTRACRHALNKTSRHNAANDAWYDAIAAVAVRRVLKGDKGDGRRVSKAKARQRYAHINAGTVPDIIALHASPSGHHVLYESKVYSPFTPSPELGTGTRAGGGSVSTAGGHRRGFGGCEELLHVKIFGTKQRGRPEDDPFDHSTGEGYVRARDGAYSDGIAKGHQVIALISESLGGIAPDARKLLIALDKLAGTDGHRDGTKYGLARTATRSFHAYHLCAISTAIVTTHAEILLQAADARAAAALRDDDLSGVSE
jgi:hypothetical protein